MANPSASGHRSATGDYRAGATTSSRRAIHAGVSPGPRRRFERARLATAKPRPPISREREERPVGGAAFGTGSADRSGPSPDRTSLPANPIAATASHSPIPQRYRHDGALRPPGAGLTPRRRRSGSPRALRPTSCRSFEAQPPYMHGLQEGCYLMRGEYRDENAASNWNHTPTIDNALAHRGRNQESQ